MNDKFTALRAAIQKNSHETSHPCFHIAPTGAMRLFHFFHSARNDQYALELRAMS